IVLRFLEEALLDPPKLARAHPRRKAPGELLAVDQPFGLRIAADERRGEKHARAAILPALGRRAQQPEMPEEADVAADELALVGGEVAAAPVVQPLSFAGAALAFLHEPGDERR